MELQYYGANCVRITTKNTAISVDDMLNELGLKGPTKAGDIALFTTSHEDPKPETKIIIDQPGEYEVSNVSITGLPARAHMDEEGKHTATMYKVATDDVKLLITGHIYPDLSDDQLEEIGLVDAMVIPVGGNGFTLDGVDALKVIKKVEPKLIIPVHYSDKAVKYKVEQQDLASVLQALGMEAKETVAKLKIKASDLQESTQLIVLERQ